MCWSLLLVVLLVSGEQKAQKVKPVTLAALRKLAAEIVADKKHGPKKPEYKVEDSTLTYRLSNLSVPKADPETRILMALVQVSRFKAAPPKGMDKKLLSQAVERAEKTTSETYQAIQKKDMTAAEVDERLDEMDEAVLSTIDKTIRSYAKKKNLLAQRVRETALVAVSTKPKDGKVYCITLFQKRLLELKGLKPEREVMQFVVGDSLYFEGWVYYVVTWDDGKKKVGPHTMFVGGRTVTFK